MTHVAVRLQPAKQDSPHCLPQCWLRKSAYATFGLRPRKPARLRLPFSHGSRSGRCRQLIVSELPSLATNAKGRTTRRLRRHLIATLEEREQIRIDLVLVGRAHAVRQPRIDFQRGSLNQLGGEKGRGADRHDLVIVAMEEERWYIKLSEIFGEVRLGEGFDAVEDGFVSSQHPLEPKRVAQALRDVGARTVGAVEGRTEIL